jgi:hypothetical protein
MNEWIPAAVVLAACVAGTLAAVGTALWPGTAGAADAPAPGRDPMRPAAAAAPAGTDAAASPPAAAESEPGGLPQFQATHRTADGRRAALLDGRWRAVGERVGDLRVAAVGEADVVLARGSERITLSLLTVRTRPAAAPQ